MISVEVPPIMDDEQAKNIGTAAAIATAVPSLILVVQYNQPYEHQQSTIDSIQSSVGQLETAKTLVGDSAAAKPAINHLDAQIANKNKALVGVEKHTPSHTSFNETWGIVFGPAFVVGMAAWVIAHKARIGRAKERTNYNELAAKLMSDRHERLEENVKLFASGVPIHELRGE